MHRLEKFVLIRIMRVMIYTFNSNNDYATIYKILNGGNGSKIHFRPFYSERMLEINDKEPVQINDSDGATTGTLYRLRWTSNNRHPLEERLVVRSIV